MNIKALALATYHSFPWPTLVEFYEPKTPLQQCLRDDFDITYANLMAKLANPSTTPILKDIIKQTIIKELVWRFLVQFHENPEQVPPAPIVVHVIEIDPSPDSPNQTTVGTPNTLYNRIQNSDLNN